MLKIKYNKRLNSVSIHSTAKCSIEIYCFMQCLEMCVYVKPKKFHTNLSAVLNYNLLFNYLLKIKKTCNLFNINLKLNIV